MAGKVLAGKMARAARARTGDPGRRIRALPRRRRREAPLQRIQSGGKRVYHRAVAGLRAAHLPHPVKPRAQRAMARSHGIDARHLGPACKNVAHHGAHPCRIVEGLHRRQHPKPGKLVRDHRVKAKPPCRWVRQGTGAGAQ